MDTFLNTEFNIKFVSTGDERCLSRMDKDEVKLFLDYAGRVTYKGQFICSAYWDNISDTLEISHENEASLYFRDSIIKLMND